MSTTVIIPTLNEVIGVQQIMPLLDKQWAEEWIVVDGGSTDGTVEEVKKLGYNLVRQSGKGLGAAYRDGVRLAQSEYVLFFSPDGNCEPSDIPRLIKKAKEGYDLVQISRFGKNGSSRDDTIVTAFGNRMFTFLVNVFFGGHLTDALYGYKIIRKNVFLDLRLDGEFETAEQQISIRGRKMEIKRCEIDGNEPKRVGGIPKMKPLRTGSMLSKQIIKEFIFWKF